MNLFNAAVTIYGNIPSVQLAIDKLSAMQASEASSVAVSAFVANCNKFVEIAKHTDTPADVDSEELNKLLPPPGATEGFCKDPEHTAAVKKAIETAVGLMGTPIATTKDGARAPHTAARITLMWSYINKLTATLEQGSDCARLSPDISSRIESVSTLS